MSNITRLTPLRNAACMVKGALKNPGSTASTLKNMKHATPAGKVKAQAQTPIEQISASASLTLTPSDVAVTIKVDAVVTPVQGELGASPSVSDLPVQVAKGNVEASELCSQSAAPVSLPKSQNTLFSAHSSTSAFKHHAALKSACVPAKLIILDLLKAKMVQASNGRESVVSLDGDMCLEAISEDTASISHNGQKEYTINLDVLLKGLHGNTLNTVRRVLLETEGDAPRKTSPCTGDERTYKLVVTYLSDIASIITLQQGNIFTAMCAITSVNGRPYTASWTFQSHEGSLSMREIICTALMTHEDQKAAGHYISSVIVRGGNLVLKTGPTRPGQTATILAHQRRYEGGGVVYHPLGATRVAYNKVSKGKANRKVRKAAPVPAAAV